MKGGESSLIKRLLTLVLLSGLSLFWINPVSALSCMVSVTKDNAYPDKCYKTVRPLTPQIAMAKQVFKKEYFTVLLFLTGCQPDSGGNVTADYDIRIERPDGSLYFEQKRIGALQQRQLNPEWTVLSASNLKFYFEAQDMAGKYRIRVKVRDGNSRQEIVQETTVELANYEYQRYFDNDVALNGWITSYYKNPTPENAIDGFLYYSQNRPAETRSVVLYDAFFREIFKNNRYLLPFLIERYEGQNSKTRMQILRLLKTLGCSQNELPKSLTKAELEQYQKPLKDAVIDPYGPWQDPLQLDALWGTFLANGSYKPIKRLVETLQFSEFKGAGEKYQNSTKPEERKKATADALYQTAKSMLKRYGSENPLVIEYCNYSYRYELLTKRVKTELDEILGHNILHTQV